VGAESVTETSDITAMTEPMGGVLGGLPYTAGPRPYKYLGLGEVAIVLLMGPLITLGTFTAVNGRTFAAAGFWVGLGPVLLIAGVLAAALIAQVALSASGLFGAWILLPLLAAPALAGCARIALSAHRPATRRAWRSRRPPAGRTCGSACCSSRRSCLTA
jgi:1,4-dihydroxy-2-naphthoate octaprenyltransferase